MEYVEMKWTEHKTQITQREFVYSIVKIRLYDYQTMADFFLDKCTGCAKVCGLFYIVLLWVLIGRAANADHMVREYVNTVLHTVQRPCSPRGYFVRFSWFSCLLLFCGEFTTFLPFSFWTAFVTGSDRIPILGMKSMKVSCCFLNQW